MIGAARKDDSGKQPISFIPAEYILGTAEVFKFGAKKYAVHNFRKGLAHSRPLDAVMRHCLAILRGEEIDPESGLPHVYHASCSLAMYDYMRLHYPELNDIFELTKEKQPCTQQLELPLTFETTNLPDYENCVKSSYFQSPIETPISKPSDKP